jgi:hypothetical protein
MCCARYRLRSNAFIVARSSRPHGSQTIESRHNDLRSTEYLRLIHRHGYLISFEKAVPSGRRKKDFICVCTSDGRAVGLNLAGYSTAHIELPRTIFNDFIEARLIEQDRPEDSDGRIFYHLTADGRSRAGD